jgi:hypothetical protein
MRIRSQLGRGTIVLLRLPSQGMADEVEPDPAGAAATLPRGDLRSDGRQLARALRAVG